jgi:hypothetical protein
MRNKGPEASGFRAADHCPASAPVSAVENGDSTAEGAVLGDGRGHGPRRDQKPALKVTMPVLVEVELKASFR